MIPSVSWTASSRLSRAKTAAPWRASRTAVAFPLPQPGPADPAPVTIATFPSSLSMLVSPLYPPVCGASAADGRAKSAVYQDLGSRDVLRLVGRQEERRVGDVPRLAHAAHRHLLVPTAVEGVPVRPGLAAGEVPRDLLDERGVHQSRQHAVQPDTAAGVVDRHHAAELHQARLGGRVARLGLSGVAD